VREEKTGVERNLGKECEGGFFFDLLKSSKYGSQPEGGHEKGVKKEE